jgi:hypothetical protein
MAKGKEIQSTGVKTADALHVACAISAGCDYFITVDGRLLKYRSDKIVVCDPVEFLRIWDHVEPFDYTEWRRTNLFPDIYVSEISKQAMEYRNAKRNLENL